MPMQAEYEPVEDTVPKVDGTVAVGEDLAFSNAGGASSASSGASSCWYYWPI